MTRLEDVTICGRRGGLPFVDARRPNSDGQCPPGTVPCSRSTSIENTICVEQDSSECGVPDNCPITEIRLVTEDLFNQSNNTNEGCQTVLDFKNWKLIYSKDRVDSLPIQATQLAETTPCYEPYRT